MSTHFLPSSIIHTPTLNYKRQPSSLTSFKNPYYVSKPIKLIRTNTTVTFATISIEQQDQATTPISKPPKSLPFRVGHGFDLHRLEPGYPLIIGGINIPHDRGCEAHSDGDVLLHCVVDAIVGALGLPDIGHIFPDNDPKVERSSIFCFRQRSCKSMTTWSQG